MCAKMIHETSSSRGPTVAISQSSTAAGRKSWYSTLPIRESPHASTGVVAATSAGKLSANQPNACSTSSERPISGTENSYQSLSQPKCLANGVSPGGSDSDRNANR